jgi:hypothetical protein
MNASYVLLRFCPIVSLSVQILVTTLLNKFPTAGPRIRRSKITTIATSIMMMAYSVKPCPNDVLGINDIITSGINAIDRSMNNKII